MLPLIRILDEYPGTADGLRPRCTAARARLSALFTAPKMTSPRIPNAGQALNSGCPAFVPALALPGGAAVFHVDAATGDDDASNGSEVSPFRTV